ncbi:Pheromone-regulated membrane protein 10 [Penicillium argentinense]|uniref:Pheromone-regulated membrane protein 10 n=1 Tax=Penicillium argentinense TaxID=1131581 RepID=A0A9W9FM93_9EURO|nr:Pheromone-regulated membrane protein 10 [Penicillium argentinense]KAJ5102834.1 Pheromone-regulated membrane protein 10 [Penicillium argentinense]
MSDPFEREKVTPSSPHNLSVDTAMEDEGHQHTMNEEHAAENDTRLEVRDEVSEQPSTTSIPERWRTLSRRVRERAGTIAEALGRPHEHGEDGLDASFSPENYGATDDLKSFQARMANDEEEKLSGHDHDSQAELLIKQLGLPTYKRHPEAQTPHSGASTPGESGASTPVNGGLLSHLLRVYANNLPAASRISVATTSSETDPETETLPPTAPGTPSTGVTAVNTAGKGAETGSSPSTGTGTGISPGTATPGGKKEKVKWYANGNESTPSKLDQLNKKMRKPQKQSGHHYTSSLIAASMDMGRVGVPGTQGTATPMGYKERKKQKRQSSKDVRLKVHIAALLARQQYIMQLCRALMKYGAPTHRLEEYMMMTSNVLDVKAQFLYIPGCMFMSFDDPLTRTAEVKIIRVIQGLDLSRLAETHNVYKNVVHDLINVEQATQDLDEIMQRKPRYNRWTLVILTGLASVAVGPYSFGARPIDLPIIFFLGCLVGFMQHILAPNSATYSNVLEVSAAILTSFLARAFGSIHHNGERVFCFAALAQSSIAMILPGFAVLSSSLELQSHQMNAGSIRMVFTIIYSLFLGYGVTVGTTIYGVMDRHATTDSACPAASLSVWGNAYIQRFPFVALFCLFAALINQAKWKQIPVTVFMGVCGYITNYFSTTVLGSNQVANTIGAFTIGLMANLYSRVWHGHAAAAIIPGIFTMVPSGLASSGSIISGLEYAEKVANGTANTTTSATNNSSLTSLGYGMIQTAIGISVGLFVSALIVYPHGKKRSGIFSL